MIIDFHTHIFPEKIAVRTIEKLEKIANVKAFTALFFKSSAACSPFDILQIIDAASSLFDRAYIYSTLSPALQTTQFRKKQ